MDSEPLFLSEDDVLDIHAEQLRRFGGAAGILDEGALASAIAQPQNAYLYGDSKTTVFDLAAAYAFHISKNHAFRDGNKRAGIAAAIAFLDVNGWLVRKDLTKEMLSLVVGEISKEEMAAALRHASRRKLGKALSDLFGR